MLLAGSACHFRRSFTIMIFNSTLFIMATNSTFFPLFLCACVCLFPEQMAMRSPDAAIEIAKIKGLSHNVTSVLSERQAMNSVKDDCVLLVKTKEQLN